MHLGDLPFFKTHSTRDNHRHLRNSFFLIGNLFLLIIWLAWFFYAPLSLTQKSKTAVLQTENRLTATFSPQITTSLSPGQPVKIIFNDFPETVYGSISGYINTIDPVFRDGYQVVEVKLNAGPLPYPLQRGLIGQVQVVTDTQTPAELILHTTMKSFSN